LKNFLISLGGETIMRNMGRVNGKRAVRGMIILLAAIGLFAPQPALATSPATATAIAAGIGSTIGAAAIAYGIYENLPSRQGEPRFLNGEFYVGGFLGPSLIQRTDWTFNNLTTAKNVALSAGVLGGLKFGYFTHAYPWFGLEAETNYTRQDVWNQTIPVSPAIPGGNRASLPTSNWYIWNSSIKLMGRYGFLPDSEVPFGRLQPYVGIGPGFEVIYSQADSAKNFSLEVEAGLRYMMLKNVSAFLEYKFSQQWNVELEMQNLYTNTTSFTRTATFDVTNHKIAVGVAYHF
jgi:opacity protein-like surface antigen